MLNKEEEIGVLEILKNNFPDLDQRSLVIGLNEFLAPDLNLKNFICLENNPKEIVKEYIIRNKAYIVMDESEGYKCLFFSGHFIKAQYDITNSKMLRYVETKTVEVDQQTK